MVYCSGTARIRIQTSKTNGIRNWSKEIEMPVPMPVVVQGEVRGLESGNLFQWPIFRNPVKEKYEKIMQLPLYDVYASKYFHTDISKVNSNILDYPLKIFSLRWNVSICVLFVYDVLTIDWRQGVIFGENDHSSPAVLEASELVGFLVIWTEHEWHFIFLHHFLFDHRPPEESNLADQLQPIRVTGAGQLPTLQA